MGLEETKSKYVWINGKYVPWADANIHICSHVIHYGTGVFEGIRCYKTPKGPAIFRQKEHTDRLFNSAKIYRMDVPFTKEQVNQAMVELIQKNGHEECYVRPLVYRGYNELGVNPFNCPVDIALITWYWGKYLGPEALEQGVDVMVSSWNRMAPNTFPAMSKTCANYMNSQLIKMEALLGGYSEGIALDTNGYVSEGSGENLFLVMNGKLYTTPLGASVLPGITRDTVIQLAEEMGLKVAEQLIPREMLYIADELFFTGTAAEISPIRSVDKIKVGEGKRGPITKKLQDIFFKHLNAEVEDKHKWLTFVY
jgi:branched-chain amino acid aminotransferase